MSDKEEHLKNEFKRITSTIIRTYQSEMEIFLRNNNGQVTEGDVTVMNMNILISVGTNIYYSLKEMLPTANIDFDFIRATVINNFVDTFDKIKDYHPKERMMPLTPEQVKEINDKGFIIIKLNDGAEKRITKEDIFVKKEDAQSIISDAKKEIIQPNRSREIIVPNARSSRRRR